MGSRFGIVVVFAGCALRVALAAEERNNILHLPETCNGILLQNGRPSMYYTSKVGGGWMCMQNGRVVASFLPGAVGGGTLWQGGRPVGWYSENSSGGWTYWENGRVVATFTPSASGGGTVWQNGRAVGRYSASSSCGWTYWQNGRGIATFVPLAPSCRTAGWRTRR